MKRLLITICTFLLIFACKESFAQGMSYPYTAGYSSNFAIGKPEHAKMILELWKDWDDNAFDRHNYFADTVVMYLSDGSVIKGKDSCIAGAKRFRGSMSKAISSIDAWLPLKSIDRNENLVGVWGSETDTYPDGKTAKREIHEIWRINKDGKVDFMKQWASAAPQQ